MEIIKILEENGIEKGNKSSHIEAALLSYRNSIAKEIINHIKEKNETKQLNENEEMINQIFKKGLIASIKSSNIKGVEMLFNIDPKISIQKIEDNMERNEETFLYHAVKHKSREIVQMLLSKGANINKKTIIVHKILIIFYIIKKI